MRLYSLQNTYIRSAVQHMKIYSNNYNLLNQKKCLYPKEQIIINKLN